MAWVYLLIAGVLEVSWAVGLKFTDGFSRLWPVVLTVIGANASVFFLALAVRSIPLGTAYAIWTGIGAVGAVVLGIALFSESADWPRLFFVLMIVVAIVGLKMTSGQ